LLFSIAILNVIVVIVIVVGEEERFEGGSLDGGRN